MNTSHPPRVRPQALIALACALGVWMGAGPAQAFIDAREAALDNGLQVRVYPVRDVPLLSISWVLRGGSSHDLRGYSGATLVLLDGMWAAQSSKAVARSEAAGMTMSHELRRQQAVVRLEGLAGQAEQMLSLLSKTLTEVPGPNVLDHIRRRNIHIVRNSPIIQSRNRLFEALFPGHPLDHHPFGRLSDLEQLRAPQVIEHYRQLIRPDRGTLVMVGDIDPVRAVDLTRSAFGKWAAQAANSAERPAEGPAQGAARPPSTLQRAARSPATLQRALETPRSIAFQPIEGATETTLLLAKPLIRASSHKAFELKVLNRVIVSLVEQSPAPIEASARVQAGPLGGYVGLSLSSKLLSAEQLYRAFAALLDGLSTGQSLSQTQVEDARNQVLFETYQALGDHRGLLEHAEVAAARGEKLSMPEAKVTLESVRTEARRYRLQDRFLMILAPAAEPLRWSRSFRATVEVP